MRKLITVIYYINRKIAKNHMIISFDTEKTFNKNPASLHGKNTQKKLEIEGDLLNLIKSI